MTNHTIAEANIISDCVNPADAGHTAWMLVAIAFVFLMTPGLAFFEAGLLRSRNSISIMMQCWAGMCILSIMWFVFGYSLALGPDQGGVIGNFDYFFFNDVEYKCAHGEGFDIPGTVFATFQMMFAVITPLLITGAFSERVPFGSFCCFIILWSIVIYYPVCHWVWGGGWLATLWDGMGAVDFAGGIVIHTTAGVSSLIVAIVLGPRNGFPGVQWCKKIETVGINMPDGTSIRSDNPKYKDHPEFKPHSIPLATIGAAMLWMGWFGFNAGSALTSGAIPGHTLLTTHIGACTCGMVWMFLGWLDSKDEKGDRHPSLVESLNGVVAGLAGVTPASGFIHSQAGFCLGIVLGLFSYYGVKLIKGKLGIDDALDVSSVHGITGIVGSLSLGFLASSKVNPAILDGWFYGGDGTMMAYQLIGVAVAGAWAGVWTLVICVGLEKTIGFRVTQDQEAAGLDATLHGETARILDASPQNQLMSPSSGPAKSAPVDDLSLDGETKPLADGANKV